MKKKIVMLELKLLKRKKKGLRLIAMSQLHEKTKMYS